MAYLGKSKYRFNIYVGNPQHGWRCREAHVYECEHCGAWRFPLYQAKEPFYCTCNQLIDISPPTERTERLINRRPE